MLQGRPGLAAPFEGCCRQPQLLLRAVGSDGCYRRLLLPQMAAPAQQPTISNQQPGEIRQARAQFGWRRKGWWLIDRCPWAEAGCPGAAIKLEAG